MAVDSVPRPHAPNASGMAGPPDGPRRLDVNYGIFVHYVPGLSVDGFGKPASLDESCSLFDLEGFVADAVAFGVEYVRFTAWHQGMFPLYPSDVMTHWRGERSSSSRDIIGELIEALSEEGIATQLYTHPRDGHDMDRRDQERTGWGATAPIGNPDPDPRSFVFSRWNDFITEAYAELVDRYGSRVQSIYWDEGSERADSTWVVDYGRLRQTILSRAEHLVIQQNFYGNLYSADVADHEYYRWGEFAESTLDHWPAYRTQSVSTVLGSIWWAGRATQFEIGFSPDDLLGYLAIQTAVNITGGGLAIAAGPLVGGGWEPGVREALIEFARRLQPIRKSIVGARPSRRWPAPDRSTATTLNWVVATETDEATFVHVLRRPTSGRVLLPRRASDDIPRSALCVRSGAEVGVSVTESALELTLRMESWDEHHTVIELRYPGEGEL